MIIEESIYKRLLKKQKEIYVRLKTIYPYNSITLPHDDLTERIVVHHHNSESVTIPGTSLEEIYAHGKF